MTAPEIGTTGEAEFSVRRNGKGEFTTEWQSGYEVMAVLPAEDRPYHLTVRHADRVLEGIAPECFRSGA